MIQSDEKPPRDKPAKPADAQVKESGNAEPPAKPGQFDSGALWDAAVWGD